MNNAKDKRPLSVGLLAHVDAGKTTLSEALLYTAGALRSLGRVDHRDAFLDTHDLERARGITIFSQQARLETDNLSVTLVDTPGHVDFSGEAERVIPALDIAVLVISATGGVQAHTRTLWELLAQYEIPVVLFINKMDLPDTDKDALLRQLQEKLDPMCCDFTTPEAAGESSALCNEALLEQYLRTGETDRGEVSRLIGSRRLFPCCFGAALKTQGVDRLLEILDTYAPEKCYPNDFGARIYKISRDAQGNRLTWLKVTGGDLSVRSAIAYKNKDGETAEEKILQIRLYSGDKFTTVQHIPAGTLCAVAGLTQTYPSLGLGAQKTKDSPSLVPVLTYRIVLPGKCDPLTVLPKLRQLEEEDPLLQLQWDGQQISARIMGQVQLEVLRSLILSRFSLNVTFTDRQIAYKETIADTVEGVGHFEPLRHYAEVHLLLEPLPRESGLQFASVCPSDVLEQNYQNLILTHLGEKTHLGVLTGAPITDMKITLLVGKAHLKHTEGGDFRQATYRALRQGLIQAQSVLLEPWYRFMLTVPVAQIGRAITDMRGMHAEFDTPETGAESACLQGTVPVAALGDYPRQVAAYTQGKGQLQLSFAGYYPCHNTDEVLLRCSYDPEADLENTPDSVFCAHGASFVVKWNQVPEYMHLESGRKEKSPGIISRNIPLEDKELEAILRRQFGDDKTVLHRKPEAAPPAEEVIIATPRKQALIVDGYNMIFAWDSLSQTAKSDLDAARRHLLDALSSYAGFRKCYLVVVFDGYKRKGNPGEKDRFHNIFVVYTREGETADSYIERLVGEIGKNYAVRVATSDGLVQLSSLRSGVLRMSARELEEEIARTRQEMERFSHQ